MTMDIAGFISELMVHFPTKFEKPEMETAWLRSYYGELRNFEPSVLQRAARELIRKPRRDKRFPALSECIKECVDAKQWLDREKNAGKLQIESARAGNHLDWTADRLKLANDLILCALGKQAAKEGWVKSLWNFARKNGRLPQPNEVEACKREHREFIETYSKLVADAAKPTPNQKTDSDSTWIHIGDAAGAVLAKAWLKMGDEMVKRQKDMAEYVLKNVR